MTDSIKAVQTLGLPENSPSTLQICEESPVKKIPKIPNFSRYPTLLQQLNDKFPLKPAIQNNFESYFNKEMMYEKEMMHEKELEDLIENEKNKRIELVRKETARFGMSPDNRKSPKGKHKNVGFCEDRNNYAYI